MHGVEPILVIFEERKEKELVWTKLRDNLKTKTNVVVTQDNSARRLDPARKPSSQSSPRNRVQPCTSDHIKPHFIYFMLKAYLEDDDNHNLENLNPHPPPPHFIM